MTQLKLKGLFLVAMLSLCSLAAHAYDCVNNGVYFKYIKKDGSYYRYSDNLWSMEVTYRTTSYNSYSGSVHVPQRDYSSSQVRYYYPLGIGEDAFRESTGLTEVTFEDEPRIAYVNNRAFLNCTSLDSVALSRSQLMLIGDSAFCNCSSLRELDLSNTKLETIGDYAFYGCTSLKTIKLPSTITSIGAYAFENCTSLTTIEIPSGATGLTTIGDYAFYNCSAVTTINIPSSVSSIGIHAFANCSALTSLSGLSSDTSPQPFRTISSPDVLRSRP